MEYQEYYQTELKAAVMASPRRYEWEASQRNQGWKIRRSDHALSWVYVQPGRRTPFVIRYMGTESKEVWTGCDDAVEAVALAERFSLGNFD